jgi:DMSO/TMAO reductase YedYZ molybdopterin-dependent catalytic subunit
MTTTRTNPDQQSPPLASGRARRFRRLGFPALAGIVSAAVLLAASELLAVLVGSISSPILAVGSFVIDIFPPWAKDLVIALFGVNDKLVLLLSLGVAVVIAAAIGGILQLWRAPLGVLVVVIAGALSTAAIVTRAGAGLVDGIPTVVGTVLAGYVMHSAIARLRRWRSAVSAPASEPTSEPTPGLARRNFLGFTLIAGAAAVVVGTGSRIAAGAMSSARALRDSVMLPTPLTTVTIPPGADLGIPGLSPLFVPNSDFYRIDTALTVPVVDPVAWRLTIGGMTEREVVLSFQDILDLGVREYVITLTCVSNEVGGPLLGNARWLGVPLREVLALAGPTARADMVLSTSFDGFTAGTPLDALTDPLRDSILAVGMNGEPLPAEHGFPVRMVVPGLYGYVSATKWLTELRVTTFAADEGYWTPRGWDALGPIKLSSRLDTPRVDRAVPPGLTKIAGVAWAQPIGVAAVDITIDGGSWLPATLSAPINNDAWVQWFVDWEASTGVHTIVVRATDNDGNVQLQERVPPAPNGSTGWQSSLVRVT